MPPLLRASEFCRRPRTVSGTHRPRPSPQPSSSRSETSTTTSAAHAQRDEDLSSSAAVVVRASILGELPPKQGGAATAASGGRRRGRGHQRRGFDGDELATVYASHPDLLVRLNAVEGRLCALFRIDDDDDDDGDDGHEGGGVSPRAGMSPSLLDRRAWAPVVLRVLPRRERRGRRRRNSRRGRVGPDGSGGEVGDETGRDGRARRLFDVNAVAEKGNDVEEETSDDVDGGGDADHRRSLDDSSLYVLHVPPCVAATAGIHDCIPSSLGRVGVMPLPLVPRGSHHPDVRRSGSTSSSVVGGMTPGVLAGRATLREIGIPPTDLLPPSCSPGGLLGRTMATTSGGEDEHDDDDAVVASSSSGEGRVKALRSYFSRARLVGRGTILAVIADGDSSSVSKSDSSSSSSAVRFYQVVDASSLPAPVSSEDDGAAVVPPRPPARTNCEEPGCFFISPETRLTLLSRGEAADRCPGPVPRPPPLSVAASFLLSVVTTLRSSVENGAGRCMAVSRGGSAVAAVDDGVVDFSIHPSIGDVVDLLLHASSSSSETPSGTGTAIGTRCVFVEGSEDNLVKGCVETAADMVGMRCLHVDGLAAFSYRYRLPAPATTSSSSAHAQVPPNVTGSIADKLVGLEAALSAASEADCVLHLANFDEELNRFAGGGGAEGGNSGGGGDPERAEDEERRIASAVRVGLSRPRGPRGDGGVSARRGVSVACATRAIVVVSSRRPLSSSSDDGGGIGTTGPIASLSSLPAASVVEPDGRFARHLWCGCDEDDDGTFDAAESVLEGRTAREIQAVRRRLSREVVRPQPDGDGTAVAEAVRSILESMDDGPVGNGGGSKLSSSLIPDVRWDDVGGLAHVRAEIMDAIELPLLHPHLFDRCPRGRSGVLLYGPPGTGKTLVAKAVATECGVPFLSVKGPELLGSYVGESEANVRAAFASARRAASAHGGRGCAILFFDELDSLASRRGGAGDGGGVMDRVVASLLGELDEHDEGGKRGDADARAATKRRGDLFVIGATNRPDLLDPSLLRPGRFDRHVYLGLCMSREDRVQILAAQMRNFTFENGLDAESTARAVIDEVPSGLSGADFSAVSSGALMRSLRRKCDEVDAEAKKRSSLQLNGQHHQSDEVQDRDVQAVLEEWDENRLVPVVSLQDIISAASSVQPSVSEEDLKKYEALKSQFGG